MQNYALPQRKVGSEVIATELRHDPALREFLRDLKQFALLTHTDELTLGEQMRSASPVVAEAARQTLVNHNLRLVVNIAKKYAGQGVPLADLIQEGTLGLMEGVKHYQPRPENRFATYAGWWVEQACKHALSNQRDIMAIPVYLDDARLKVQRFTTAYEMEHGSAPSDEQIVAATGVLDWKLPLIERIKPEVVSLDQQQNDTTDETISETLADARVDVEAEALANLDLNDLYRTLRQHLTTRELLVLCYRYRLGGLSLTLGDLDDDATLDEQRGPQYQGLMSLTEVSLRLNLSPTSVSISEQSALAKLRQVYGAQTDRILAALQAA